jgi:formylglycine-generating enzyme
MRDNPTFLTNEKDGTEMVLIPGGWFRMGPAGEDTDASPDEKPRHLHCLAPYYLGIYCVTVGQFGRFVREPGYDGGKYPLTEEVDHESWEYWKKDPPDHPVRYVTWHDASAYAQWAQLRLPTEAEWELGARGRNEAFCYPWGNDWEKGRRVRRHGQKGVIGSTCSVSSHPNGVSPFGIYQQSGNVWEWCADWYDERVYKRYTKGKFTQPEKGKQRVQRGASWYERTPDAFSGTKRHGGNPESRGFTGFRLAKSVVSLSIDTP